MVFLFLDNGVSVICFTFLYRIITELSDYSLQIMSCHFDTYRLFIKKKKHTVVWYFISEQAFNASQEIHVDLKEFIMECSN